MRMKIVFIMILSQLLNTIAIPIVNHDKIFDRENRIYNALNILPMRCGGGYPSTNEGMPSGGGRWND